ncbi:zf-TFIIB domain-containing protein [Sphingomonas sp. BK481]|jgi:hypothetical protein|uniref:TFIIB-type zinc ribbon-containing protein n=1 Tax=unclassified Sphingomonas TaxID=196159 RepID=UPI0012E2BBCF|nr:hypothetical protein SPHINGOT1_620040 [Sphingomonas sp. T1]
MHVLSRVPDRPHACGQAGGEIECCAQCRGIWLNRGELDKIIIDKNALFEATARPAPDFRYSRLSLDTPSLLFGADTMRDLMAVGTVTASMATVVMLPIALATSLAVCSSIDRQSAACSKQIGVS